VIRKIPSQDQAAEACLREPHLNLPFENIDNRMRIMPVDRVDGSWGVIDSNDLNFFPWCVRQVFRKERIHLLGMRRRRKSEGKAKYREDELLHVMHLFCPFGDVLRVPAQSILCGGYSPGILRKLIASRFQPWVVMIADEKLTSSS